MIFKKNRRLVAFLFALNLIIQSLLTPVVSFSVWASEIDTQAEVSQKVSVLETETQESNTPPDIDANQVLDTEIFETDISASPDETTDTIIVESDPVTVSQVSSDQVEENILFQSLLPVTTTPEFLAAQVFTDKEDYAPTDMVIVTVRNLVAQGQYRIVISSDDDPAVTHEGSALANDEGVIIYSYQLDGIYRPDYVVRVYDMDGTKVAMTTFTDSISLISIKINGQNKVVVYPETTLSIEVSVTTDKDSDNNWQSTKFELNNSTICDSTPNYVGVGTYKHTFELISPAGTDKYDLEITVYTEDNCEAVGKKRDSEKVKNAVEVIPVVIDDEDENVDDKEKVRICHATASDEVNPYVSIKVSPSSLGPNEGSSQHDHNSDNHQDGRDIIPPGYWDEDGRNWNAAGQAIWNNDCKIVEAPQIGHISGMKWNDINGNSARDCEYDNELRLFEVDEDDRCEPTLSGITIFLDENENKELDEGELFTVTDEDGKYRFDNLPTGNYTICEVVPTGWSQTFPGENSCHSVEVTAGNEVRENFGNQFVDPRIEITKSNNAISKRVGGDTVEYTIEVNVLDNDVRDLKVIDLPPHGFSYVAGSYRAYLNDVPLSISEPVYSSPGTWSMGDVSAGSLIKLVYTAKIIENADPGMYSDLAYATGMGGYGEDIRLLAWVPETHASYVSDNMAGTQVLVDKDLRNVLTMEVDKTEIKTVTGQVLGASTDLPRTGTSLYWTLIALTMITTGAGSIYYAIKKENE
jgi:uncharacterized repeat protein (TIGR01451 family)